MTELNTVWAFRAKLIQTRIRVEALAAMRPYSTLDLWSKDYELATDRAACELAAAERNWVSVSGITTKELP